MRAVKNSILLCTIFLLGSQLSRALNPTSDVSSSTDLSLFPNERILESVTYDCNPTSCPPASNSIQNQTSPLIFKINFGTQSKITIQIQVGKSATTLQVSLSSSPSVPMVTKFSLSPSDSSQDVSIASLNGANWDNSLSFGSSSYSSRQLIVTIENDSPSQSITSYFSITVTSTDDSSSSSSSWGSAVGGAIGAVIVVLIIVYCIRRRRMRRLMRRRREASYQAQNIQQFPQQQPGQPGPFQPQLQGSIIYQPINQNSPHYSMQMQQSGNIQYVPVAADPNNQFQQSIQYIPVANPNYQQQPNIQYVPIVADPNSQQQQNIQYIPVADPNYQQQPNIQYVAVANYPQPDYQGQGIQLAPPVQMAMPVNPEEGPLSEMNLNYRFPEAPFQNFSSSFPQKTCSVCLEDLKTDQNCRQLYCEHIFHGECVKDWLLNQMVKQNHGYCPNCNKNMTFVLERAKL